MPLYKPRQNAESCFLDGRLPRLHHFSYCEGAHVPRAMHVSPGFAELVYIAAGEGEHRIGDGIYRTGPGDIVLYDAGVPHDERALGDGTLCCYTLGLTNLRRRGLPENAVLGDGVVPVLHAGEAAARMETLCRCLRDELARGRVFSGEIARYLMLSVLLDVLELAGAAAPLPPQRVTLGMRIKRYLDAHYREELTLAAISSALGVSAYHLARLCKEHTGFSPMQYIISRRMGEAQTLLLATEEPVTRIAERVGYDNPNYFSLLFKKNIGVTPGQYRRMMHPEEERFGTK